VPTGGSTVHSRYSLRSTFTVGPQRLVPWKKKEITPTPILNKEHAIRHLAATTQAQPLLLCRRPCTCCCSAADARAAAAPPLMDGGDGEEEDVATHESRGWTNTTE
jgi:hypothetical protein